MDFTQGMGEGYPPQRSQPLMKLEDLHRKTAESNQKRKLMFQRILEQVQQQYPEQSAMQQYLRATGLLQQENMRSTQSGIQSNEATKRTNQTY